MAVETLAQLHTLMGSTVPARRRLTKDVLASRTPDAGAMTRLQEALAALEAIPEEREGRRLTLDAGGAVHVDLGYEIGELKKDLLFLEKGKEALLGRLAEVHPRLREEVEAGVEALGGVRYQAFVTDRDGTVNNYCGRYVTSVQSVYNAVFLTRFARARTRKAVIVTSAPLDDIGLVDLAVAPTGIFTYAGSKGREYLDPQGRRKQYPIAREKQGRLDLLNERLDALLETPGHEAFTLIGSGLQHKFGQTTIARQDIAGSIPEERSKAFLDEVRKLVGDVDPEGDFFRIEDTGLDVEILLTVDDDPSGATRDFDKGDGLRFLNDDLPLYMGAGTCLVCGDTPSDVPLLQASLALAPGTRAAFVTRKDELRQRVRDVLPNALFQSEPDALVATLNALAEAPLRP
jgi:hypothetical protein